MSAEGLQGLVCVTVLLPISMHREEKPLTDYDFLVLEEIFEACEVAMFPPALTDVAEELQPLLSPLPHSASSKPSAPLLFFHNIKT